ncbi:hypothetical protein, partial [Mesorhizobium sp.]|uniref:hypothetical protein n=1 Tax=Mesorhizobium sp. TaxID=1871066 RepID=UPI002580E665
RKRQPPSNGDLKRDRQEWDTFRFRLRFDPINMAAASTRPLACLQSGAYLVSFGDTRRLSCGPSSVTKRRIRHGFGC